jgi:hypothetical protein
MNLLCLTGLTPFLSIVYIDNLESLWGFIAIIVLFNGLVYHTTEKKIFRMIDIVTNLALILYVNMITMWQPYCACLTLFSIIFFGINLFTTSNFIHIILIQFPLAIALYESRKYS